MQAEAQLVENARRNEATKEKSVCLPHTGAVCLTHVLFASVCPSHVLLQLARSRHLLSCRQKLIKQEQAAASSALEEGKKVNKEERNYFLTALSQHRALKNKDTQERQRQKHMEKRMKDILRLKESIAKSEVSS